MFNLYLLICNKTCKNYMILNVRPVFSCAISLQQKHIPSNCITLKLMRKLRQDHILTYCINYYEKNCFAIRSNFMECTPDVNWGSAGVKNAWSCTSVPTFVFIARCLSSEMSLIKDHCRSTKQVKIPKSSLRHCRKQMLRNYEHLLRDLTRERNLSSQCITV